MILHVDLDAFFASVEQRDNPALRGKPIIVGGPAYAEGAIGEASAGKPSVSRGVVATASYEARKFGIHSGMPLFRAKVLCPQAILVPGNFAKYELASEQFAAICSSYSPIIEQVSLDELYIDLADTEKLYTPHDAAIKIQTRVGNEIGITCSVGISEQKTLAKLASGFKKPNGITEIAIGAEKEFLAPLPVGDLPGCGRQTQKLLKDLGVHTVGDLAAMHKVHVELLLGKNGVHLWKVANGIDDSKVIPPTDAKSTSRSTTFPFDTNDRGFIEGMLFYLSHKVGQDLRTARVAGRCIYLTVRTGDFTTTSMQNTLSDSISTAKEIFSVGKTLLDKLWDGSTELRLVGIGISNFVTPPRCEYASSLFTKVGCSRTSEVKQGKWLSLERAMDKIRKKHGFLSIMPLSVSKIKGQYPSSVRSAKTAKGGN